MMIHAGWWVLALGASTAHAQSAELGGIDAHGFNLVAFDGDLRDGLTVHRPGRFEAWDFFFGALGEYAESPLIFYYENRDGEIYDSEVALDNVYALNLDAGVSVHERVRLDVAAPLFFSSLGNAGSQGVDIGDLRASALVAIIRPDIDDRGFGLGVVGHLDVPTGTSEDFLGSDGVSGGGRVTGSYAWEKVTLSGDLGVQGNGAIENINLNGADVLLSGLSVGYLLGERTGVTLEGRYGAALVANEQQGTGSPGEVLLHGRHRLNSGTFFTLGGAAGYTDGAGAASYRIFAGVGFGRLQQAVVGPIDTDGDGLVDGEDLCPREPEDMDGVQDIDGCPEQEQQLAVAVKSPDGDVIANPTVEISGDELDGPVADDEIAVPAGTYTVTVSAEGYTSETREVTVTEGADVLEEIILEPVVPTGAVIVKVFNPEGQRVDAAVTFSDVSVLTTNGMLEQPLPAGEQTIEARADGYAVETATFTVVEDEVVEVRIDLKPSLIELTEERIELRDSVYFETAKSVIKPESYPLLNEVVQVMKDHPEILLLRIEGHTDSRGSAAYNLNLSKDRAASVRQYLIDGGVSPERLVSEGFGESRPIDPAQTAAAYEKNRRVDFFIADRSD
ncbi:MAG: OmpA family protein [Myxococcota bacterium]